MSTATDAPQQNGSATAEQATETQTVEMREAIRQGISEEMHRDQNVFVLGEEVAEYNGAYKVTKGMLDEFGPERIRDTPITESGFSGLAIGAAMMGLRPVVEYMSWNFSFVAFDQLISNASKMHYMTGGMFQVPVVFRGPNGAGPRVSSQHSHSVEALYAHFPGLIVCSVCTPYDAKGLIKTAIRSDNPVCFLENEMLYGYKQEIPTGEYLLPFGVADVKRAGSDCTVVAINRCVHRALAVAEELAADGIECEVVDPRTIKPLDIDTIVESVRKTNRLVIVEECHQFGGCSAEIAMQVQERAFDDLDAPIARVTQQECPLPYAANLEAESIPNPRRIGEAVRRVCYR